MTSKPSFMPDVMYLEGNDMVRTKTNSVDVTVRKQMKKPMIILLQRSTCGYCQMAKAEYVQAMADMKRAGNDVLWATIQIDGPRDDAGAMEVLAQFLNDNTLSGVPAYVCIDRHGNLLDSGKAGLEDKENVKKMAEMLMRR